MNEMCSRYNTVDYLQNTYKWYPHLADDGEDRGDSITKNLQSQFVLAIKTIPHPNYYPPSTV